eukprot:5616278-Amphidinium_carterae.2
MIGLKGPMVCSLRENGSTACQPGILACSCEIRSLGTEVQRKVVGVEDRQGTPTLTHVAKARKQDTSLNWNCAHVMVLVSLVSGSPMTDMTSRVSGFDRSSRPDAQ